MKTRILSALALMLVVALPASARNPHPVLEDGYEVEASFVSMPSSTGGLLSWGCKSCAAQRFQLASDARFYVGKQEVSFAEFKTYLAANPEKAVTIVTSRALNAVTRIKAST
jgi:hypothetical protein